MIHYRAFRNSDPPHLAQIWRSQAVQRGLVQPMSSLRLEQTVLAKPYFDREGLIVAADDERPVGFVHAGFGPTDDEQGLSREAGVTSLLMVEPAADVATIAPELLRRSEEYLRSRGAKVLYAGGIRPLNPFYLGLYGGSELPGVLDSDLTGHALFLAHGYVEIDRVIVLHRDLATYRAPVDRQQMQVRRSTTFDTLAEPVARTWWDACTMGEFERTRYELLPKPAGPPLATVDFWRMTQHSIGWGVNAAGLIDLSVLDSRRRQGLATFLLGEAFRELQQEGINLIEVQAMQSNTAALRLYQKLGFREVDRGSVFRKATSGGVAPSGADSAGA